MRNKDFYIQKNQLSGIKEMGKLWPACKNLGNIVSRSLSWWVYRRTSFRQPKYQTSYDSFLTKRLDAINISHVSFYKCCPFHYSKCTVLAEFSLLKIVVLFFLECFKPCMISPVLKQKDYFMCELPQKKTHKSYFTCKWSFKIQYYCVRILAESVWREARLINAVLWTNN